MGKRKKLISRILSGRSDTNIAFSDLAGLLESLGFDHRQKGSHHIFTMAGLKDRVNLQECTGKAKAYQVRQVRRILTDNRLIEND